MNAPMDNVYNISNALVSGADRFYLMLVHGVARSSLSVSAIILGGKNEEIFLSESLCNLGNIPINFEPYAIMSVK